MKRPEGFDRPVEPPAREPKPRREPKPAGQRTRAQEPDPAPRRPARARSEQRRPDPVRTVAAQAARSEHVTAAAERKAKRVAARQRRRIERAELRRFTRRARNRRVAIAAVVGTLLTVAGLVLVAVFSPLLALREVNVLGTSRVDAAQVRAALSEQLGTPLALIDESRITTALSAFPLVRSFVTELVPPHTMNVHVVEREPIGTVVDTAHGFALVDPAGITLQLSPERLPGVPLLDVPAASGAGFDAVVEVLLALPPDLLSQVDSATASSRDSVTLVLTGVGQSVRWGSAEDSARKSALLAALISVTDSSLPGEFDVSAPTNGVFRPA